MSYWVVFGKVVGVNVLDVVVLRWVKFIWFIKVKLSIEFNYKCECFG